MGITELLPVINRIASSLSRKHHHDVDDLRGQGTLMLVSMMNQGTDVPKIITTIQHGLVQWMSKDKVIPKNYKASMKKATTLESINDDSIAVEPQVLIELREELLQLPETETEQIYVDMKLDGYDDNDVSEKTNLALGTIQNMKTRLKGRYYGRCGRSTDCCSSCIHSMDNMGTRSKRDSE